MTKISLKAKEIKRMKHWDVNMFFNTSSNQKSLFSGFVGQTKRRQLCVSEGSWKY